MFPQSAANAHATPRTSAADMALDSCMARLLHSTKYIFVALFYLLMSINLCAYVSVHVIYLFKRVNIIYDK